MWTFFPLLVRGAVVVMEILLFSGCVEASPPGGEQKEFQASPRGMSASEKREAGLGGSSSMPLESVEHRDDQPKASSHAQPDRQGQESSAPASRSSGKAESPLLAEAEPWVEKTSAKPSQPSAKDSSPSGKASPPPAKSSASEGKPKPIYGLPLEYHFELPEVPERIRGPTPMPVVSKPTIPGPQPKRE